MIVRMGDIIPIALQLFDGNVSKYAKAIIKDHLGVQISGSPVSLIHAGLGLYINNTVQMPSVPYVTVQYEVYDDVGLTSKSTYYSNAIDTITLEHTQDTQSILLTGNIQSTEEIVGEIQSQEVVGIIESLEFNNC